MSVPTGFAADQVVVVRMNVLSRERATVPARAQYAEGLVRGVSAVPGVVDASAIQSQFVLNATMQSAIDVEGVVIGRDGSFPWGKIHASPIASVRARSAVRDAVASSVRGVT
jgi:hypothetical protein